MKRIITFFIAAAVFSFSCTKEADMQKEEVQAVKTVFTAISAENSKATISFPDVNWEYTDIVKVYNGTKSADFTITPGSISGSSASLEGALIIDAANTYAVYPSSAAVSCTSTGALTVTLPECQFVPSGKNVDPSALLIAAATTGTSLQFKNLCSIVKVSISGDDVTGIVVTSNGGELICGTASVTLSTSANPVIAVTEGRNFVDMRAEGYGTLAAGDYYIPIFPVTMASGISVGVRKAACAEKTLTNTSSLEFARSGGKSIPNVDVAAESKTAENLVRQFKDLEIDGNSGLSLKLGNDIDMKKAETAGCTFNGVLDGQGHNIYNFKAVGGVNVGLFTSVSGTSEIKNINFGTADGSTYDGFSLIEPKCVTASTSVKAGIVSYVASGTLAVTDVTNFAPINSLADTQPTSSFLGAICGMADGKVSFTRVTNNGNVTQNALGPLFGAGIIANVNCGGTVNFTNCTNNGAITCNAVITSGSNYVGGLVGKGIVADMKLNFSYCTNNGNITNEKGKGTVYVAGFVGNFGTGSTPQVTSYMVADHCTNNGTIRNKVASGMRLAGFVGSAYGGFTATNSVNNGPVIVDKCTTDSRIGGFVGGNTSSKAGKITNCINGAGARITIRGGIANFKAYAGGFVGLASPTYTLTNCENHADITIDKGSYTSNISKIGGLAGGMDASFSATGCVSDAAISTTAATTRQFGQIIGYCKSTLTLKTTGVGGSVNGTALTSENWKTLIYTSAGTTTNVITDGSANSCYFISGSTPASVKVGTFNLWSSNARKGDLNDSKTTEARLWQHAVDGIAKTINSMNCDVIGFNEIDAGVLNHASLEESEELIARVNTLNSNKYTWHMSFSNYADGTIHSNGFCNGFAYDAAKLTLVGSPVRVWLRGTAATVSTTAIDGGRTLIYAKFRENTSNKLFWFCVSHFNLGDDGGPSLYNAKCCVNWALSNANHDIPCILVGDMNCASVTTRPSTHAEMLTYWSDAYALASAAGVLDGDNASKPATRPGTSKNGTGTTSELSSLTSEANRYDHIFVDKAQVSAYSCIRDFYAAVGAEGSFWPSDHFPITATITL